MLLGSLTIPVGRTELIQRPSPNFGERRGGYTPRLIVLHYTAMETAEAAIARLCAPEYEVSAHYVIDQKGGISQLVAEACRAWHAGAGQWGNCRDVNSASIGIEPPASELASEVLDQRVCQRFVSTLLRANLSAPKPEI